MHKRYAIILAGGKGLRLSGDDPKQFLPIAGKPMLIWSAETFGRMEEIDHIIIVSPPEFIDRTDTMVRQYGIQKISAIIAGGKTRQESAYNALTSMAFHDKDILLFHDAARPFVRPGAIAECVRETEKHGASALYVPVVDTITEIDDGMVKSILPRQGLHLTQTPQSFNFEIIKKAHERALAYTGFGATDDVSLAAAAGFKVKCVAGDYNNFKITTPADYALACHLADDLPLFTSMP